MYYEKVYRYFIDSSFGFGAGGLRRHNKQMKQQTKLQLQQQKAQPS